MNLDMHDMQAKPNSEIIFQTCYNEDKIAKSQTLCSRIKAEESRAKKIFTTKKTLWQIFWSHFLHWQSFSRALKTLKKGEMEKTVGGVVVRRCIESV